MCGLFCCFVCEVVEKYHSVDVEADWFVLRGCFDGDNVIIIDFDHDEWSFPDGGKLLIWDVLVYWKRC